MPPKDTATMLLDEAQSLVQERGFNAFSYKDLAASVGIRTASIHYHFPSKGELGLALMERYRAALDEFLITLDQRRGSCRARLKAFADAYAETEARGAICLCGSLAGDRFTLPTDLQEAVAGYLERTLSWIQDTLEAGVRAREFQLPPKVKSKDLAASLMAGLQGALLLARGAATGPLVARVRRAFFSSLRDA